VCGTRGGPNDILGKPSVRRTDIRQTDMVWFLPIEGLYPEDSEEDILHSHWSSMTSIFIDQLLTTIA